MILFFKGGYFLRTYQILFDLDKATIRYGFDYLDSVAAFLQKNKNLKIEVGNHCDERWEPIYATCTTCNRARAITDYLISKGISSERLVAKGYNDLKPLIEGAKTEEEHRKNRRTEFKILSK